MQPGRAAPFFFLLFAEFQPDDLHAHPVVAHAREEAEKAGDRRILEVVVAEHIAPARDPQPRRPAGKLPRRVRDGEIGPDVPDLRVLDPRLEHQADRLLVGRVKDQPRAREGRRHRLHERLDLLAQKIIEHARGKQGPLP